MKIAHFVSKFFLRTLGYKKFPYCLGNKVQQNRDCLDRTLQICVADMRQFTKWRNRRNKVSLIISNHITLLLATTNENAPLRRYLSSGMIVAKNAFQLQRKTPRWKCFLWIVLKDLCVNENQFYNVRRKRMRRMRRVQVTWFPLEWSWTWSRDK